MTMGREMLVRMYNMAIDCRAYQPSETDSASKHDPPSNRL